MLAAVGHARLQQAVHEALGQQRHHARVAVEGSVADDAASGRAGPPQAFRAPVGGSQRLRWRGGLIRPVEVQHGREAEVHATGAQLGAQHVARRRGGVGGAQRATAGHGLGTLAVIHPHVTQRPHGRQVGEAIGAKTLHAAAFMVHTDQQVIAHGLDAAGELQQLCAVFPIAGEQDHAAGQRVCQTAAIGGGQLCACHVEDEGCVFGHRASNREIAI